MQSGMPAVLRDRRAVPRTDNGEIDSMAEFVGQPNHAAWAPLDRVNAAPKCTHVGIHVSCVQEFRV